MCIRDRLKVDGNWYLFNNSGAMKTGWQISGGRWYYMDGSGKMLTGWQQLKGKWYFLNTSGAVSYTHLENIEKDRKSA